MIIGIIVLSIVLGRLRVMEMEGLSLRVVMCLFG